VAKIDPYFTVFTEYLLAVRGVYHDQDNCEDGRAILPEHRVFGRGNRPRCTKCAKLDNAAPDDLALKMAVAAKREFRRLELQRMSMADLRKALVAHEGASKLSELDKAHAHAIIESILDIEFPKNPK